MLINKSTGLLDIVYIVCIVWCAIATELFSTTTAGWFEALRALADKPEHGEVRHGSS
ncbi:MAG: hypothetical protein V7L27_28820 [Nostoc sp.]|uniref:hypothetical protein n=1 Tax=Nostoc sp. TaxID=1180 RepID=UPI002FF715E9